MEQPTQETINDVVSHVAKAMSDAVKQYGPDAVDLALMAYRVEAAQQLLHGVAFAVVSSAILWAYAKFWAWSGTKLDGGVDDEPYYIGRAVVGFLVAWASALFTVSAMYRLLDVSAWLAAFGAPELRVAMKALEAAGLL